MNKRRRFINEDAKTDDDFKRAISKRSQADDLDDAAAPEDDDWDQCVQISSEGGDDVFAQTYDAKADPELKEASAKKAYMGQQLNENFQFMKWLKNEVTQAGGWENLDVNKLIADLPDEAPDKMFSPRWMANDLPIDLPKFGYDVPKDYFINQVRGANAAANTTAANKPKVELGDDAKAILAAFKDYEDKEQSIAEAVNDKYDSIYYAVLSAARCKSLKRHVLLYGGAGCGKTFMIMQALRKTFGDDLTGTNDKGYTCIRNNGSVGTSKTAIIAFFYKLRYHKIIFLDDCDGFLEIKDQDIQNMLKGMLDPDNTEKDPIAITVPATVVPGVNKLLGLGGGKQEESRNFKSIYGELYNDKPLYESDDDDDIRFDDDDDTDIPFDDEEPSEDMIGDDEPLSTRNFFFHSALIIASNLERKDLNSAVLSRCESIELNLTTPEFLYRLKTILPNLKTNDDLDLDPKVQSYLYGRAYKELAAAIELSENGEEVFGKPIRIARHLEFRIVPELAGKLQRCMDMYIDRNGIDGPVEEVYPKVAAKVQATFWKRYMLPTLATA